MDFRCEVNPVGLRAFALSVLCVLLAVKIDSS